MTDIKPALTPEGWASMGLLIGGRGAARLHRDGLHVDQMSLFGPEKHAIAALALHDQPFGFTWRDVDLLHAVIATVGAWDVEKQDYVEPEFDSLAKRIAALLPPRENT